MYFYRPELSRGMQAQGVLRIASGSGDSITSATFTLVAWVSLLYSAPCHRHYFEYSHADICHLTLLIGP